MLEAIGVIVAICMSIGSVIVGVVTQFNHVKHLKDDMIKREAEIKDLYIKIDGIHESFSEVKADVKAMKGICDERHK